MMAQHIFFFLISALLIAAIIYLYKRSDRINSGGNMERLTRREFLIWASDREIGLDKRYKEPGLVYIPHRDFRRFWVVPRDIEQLKKFVEHALDGLEKWEYCMEWHRDGFWPSLKDELDDTERKLLQFADAFIDGRGAVVYFYENREKIIALMTASLHFGWCVDDDLFMIPDHGRQFLFADHHDALWVEFANEDQIPSFIEHMKNGGYPLPNKYPDRTFSKQKWIDG